MLDDRLLLQHTVLGFNKPIYRYLSLAAVITAVSSF